MPAGLPSASRPTASKALTGSAKTSSRTTLPSRSSHISVSIFSYAGEVRIGLAVDAGLVTEPQQIVDAFHTECEELAALARPAVRTGVVSAVAD